MTTLGANPTIRCENCVGAELAKGAVGVEARPRVEGRRKKVGKEGRSLAEERGNSYDIWPGKSLTSFYDRSNINEFIIFDILWYSFLDVKKGKRK